MRLLLGLVCGLLLVGASAQAYADDAVLYWSYPSVIDNATVTSLSCPSTTLCVGTDDRGDVVTSTEPTGGEGAWTTMSVDHEAEESSVGAPYALYGVSCALPAGSLCVAVGERGIFTSSDPTGGAGAWTPVIGAASSRVVSCPSATMCVAADVFGGEITTSTDPTGGASAWKAALVDKAGNIVALSCPSESLCVGVDDTGQLLTSVDPTGGAAAWTVGPVGTLSLSGVSCPSTSFCFAVGIGGVASSTNPAGGASSWTAQEGVQVGHLDILNNGGFSQVACASSSLCVSPGWNGEIAESNDPTGGAGSWTSTGSIDGTNQLTSVACPSQSMCFAADEALMIGVPAHRLSVSVIGEGHGIVKSTPISCPFGCTYTGSPCPRDCNGLFANAHIGGRLNAIGCIDSGLSPGEYGGACEVSFPAQDSVTLTATPDPGSTFTGWGGACRGDESCNLTMAGEQAVAATFALVAPTKTPSTSPALALTGVAQAHARWREPSAPRVAGARKKLPPVGTTFSFALNESASVTLSFVALSGGRRLRTVCVRQTDENKSRLRCTRSRRVGTLAMHAHEGANTIRFDGLVSAHRNLKPGSYLLRITAVASDGHAVSATLRFTIARS